MKGGAGVSGVLGWGKVEVDLHVAWRAEVGCGPMVQVLLERALKQTHDLLRQTARAEVVVYSLLSIVPYGCHGA